MPSIKKRVSLLRAYKGICPYCNQPIASLADLEVDHIVPESLKESELKPLLERIGFPTLQINSYRNWLPVHGYNCNLRKSGSILPDTALAMQLHFAAEKEPSVIAEEQRFDRELRSRDALALLVREIELGSFSKEAAIAFLQGVKSQAQKRSESWVLSFSVNLAEAIESVLSLRKSCRATLKMRSRVILTKSTWTSRKLILPIRLKGSCRMRCRIKSTA